MLAEAHSLVSIVVVCRDLPEVTTQCLERVRTFSTSPYELLIVDNGSSDETVIRLKLWEKMPGPERVVIVHNAVNLGFATACNQALAVAQGVCIAILHNDVLVSAGWLETMLAWLACPDVGLVGPATNQGVPAQHTPFTFANHSELSEFAARRRLAFAGKARPAKRLHSCCMAFRRELVERLGPFDQRFGIGYFEDEDWCLRIREAGLKLVVALDVYVHHFGGLTFQAMGIDCAEQASRNLDVFRQKWGPDRSAGYHCESTARQPAAIPPQAKFDLSRDNPGLAVSVRSPARVSLCLIVKNEAANLPACLGPVRSMMADIHVVDTGSTDDTRAVARSLGAVVHDFVWVDSFAAARNESLRHATGDWIMWLDADDRVDNTNCLRLYELIANLRPENLAFTMAQCSLPDALTGTALRVDHVRLFRNHPAIRWEYRVHEQILRAVRRAGGRAQPVDISIQHLGYQDAEMRQRKAARNLRLLLLDETDHPKDAFILFNLGATYLDMGQPATALPVLKRSLKQADWSASITSKLFSLLVHTHRALQQNEEAMAACIEGRRRYPQEGDLLFEEGLLRAERGELSLAEAAFQQLLESSQFVHYTGTDAGLRGFKTRHHLALLQRRQGRLAQAEVHWREAVAENPHFVAAWMGLVDLLLFQGRETEMAALANQLERQVPGAEPAFLIRAKMFQHRREFTQARDLLIEVGRIRPQSLYPRLLLSQVLIQGGNHAEAARLLEEVLALEPGHCQARQQLESLRR